MLILGVPVKKLRGTFPYLPKAAASGGGGITLFDLNSELASLTPQSSWPWIIVQFMRRNVRRKINDVSRIDVLLKH